MKTVGGVTGSCCSGRGCCKLKDLRHVTYFRFSLHLVPEEHGWLALKTKLDGVLFIVEFFGNGCRR